MEVNDRFDTLALLRAIGLTVTLDTGRLIVLPADRLTDDARRLIRAHRANIVASLEAEQGEVVCLLAQCGDAYRFTEQEHAEAIACALADHEAALRCFRAMASKLPPEECPNHKIG